MGADFLVQNERKETFIHNCLIKRNKNPNFLSGLMEGLSQCLSESELKQVVNCPSGFKHRTPIHYAARLHPTYFKTLQKYGADISIRDADDMTALDLGTFFSPLFLLFSQRLKQNSRAFRYQRNENLSTKQRI